MKTKRGSSRARGMVTCTSAASILLAVVAERDARAGCNDGACGRIDWTEVTDMDQGAPAAAKLHGAYAWEASPDGWATHPLAGELSGYFWLTCRPAGGVADPTCKQALATEIAKAGTTTTIGFTGSYFSDGGAIRPPGLFGEGQTASPALYGVDTQVGGNPMNPQVCPAALALPRNGSDGGATDDAGGAGAGGSGAGGSGGAGNAGSGNGGAGTSGGSAGSAGATVAPAPPADDGGCSVAPRGTSRDARFAGFLLLSAGLGVAKRLRKRG